MGLAHKLYLRDGIMEPIIPLIKNLVGTNHGEKSSQPTVFQSKLDDRSGTMTSISEVFKLSCKEAQDHLINVSEVGYASKASKESKAEANSDLMVTEFESPCFEHTILRTSNIEKSPKSMPKTLSSSTDSLIETTFTSLMDKKPSQEIPRACSDSGDVECDILEKEHDLIDSLHSLQADDSHASTVHLLKNQDGSQSSKQCGSGDGTELALVSNMVDGYINKKVSGWVLGKIYFLSKYTL